MMSRTLAAVAREVQGRLIGADQAFGAVTTDTRALGAGSRDNPHVSSIWDDDDIARRVKDGHAFTRFR